MLSEEEFQGLGASEKSEYIWKLRGIKGRESLVKFSREILGYKDIDGEVHSGMEHILRKEGRRKLILMPRGTFKTSLGTISYSLWRLVRDRNLRILLDSEVLSNSMEWLEKMKEHLRSREFKLAYGDLLGDKYRETAREFTLKTRDDKIRREPSVYAGGIGTVQVGPHYDLIIADDLHSEKNVSTKEQIDKVIAHYRLLLSLLDPTGELVIMGTRWHFYDLYSFILEEEPEGWEIYIESAVKKDGSLFFPKRLTREFLDEQRKSQGAYLYSALYMNNPVSGESQIFRKEDFRYWGSEFDDHPLLDSKRVLLNNYILIDRAFSTKESADYTGLALVGVSSDSSLYILEAQRRKCGLQELFDTVVKWGNKYGWDRLLKIGIETINYEEVLAYFQEQMRKSNKFFILERLSPDSRQSKKDRITTALSARYANHAVYHRKRMVDLEDELLRFPVAPHDDIIDCVAYVVQLMNAPGDPKCETEEVEYIESGLFGKTGY